MNSPIISPSPLSFHCLSTTTTAPPPNQHHSPPLPSLSVPHAFRSPSVAVTAAHVFPLRRC
ncbi:hypothetical protein L195_g035151 [Trifolium pratense]|uniref:Uncharacterized protein n=1 Tax=Trifolium pratense TaxID=57577 RepID=A0A2K3LKV6_TRIPR|nr:hypothetical protein L195_g035151 [Trifolium pratense]